MRLTRPALTLIGLRRGRPPVVSPERWAGRAPAPVLARQNARASRRPRASPASDAFPRQASSLTCLLARRPGRVGGGQQAERGQQDERHGRTPGAGPSRPEQPAGRGADRRASPPGRRREPMPGDRGRRPALQLARGSAGWTIWRDRREGRRRARRVAAWLRGVAFDRDAGENHGGVGTRDRARARCRCAVSGQAAPRRSPATSAPSPTSSPARRRAADQLSSGPAAGPPEPPRSRRPRVHGCPSRKSSAAAT